MSDAEVAAAFAASAEAARKLYEERALEEQVRALVPEKRQEPDKSAGEKRLREILPRLLESKSVQDAIKSGHSTHLEFSRFDDEFKLFHGVPDDVCVVVSGVSFWYNYELRPGDTVKDDWMEYACLYVNPETK
jgi:hypothetical protein